ncbi:SMI1/KNR4 family protein [Gimesia algae]|uniref:SMI1 / KNR4 family protein n=1 Tax=Gimesia algae TaxID=2527971 RepID=A0A517VIK1_9PLAN|nr:SMI1/KNR4 family protein [Gimesia algae]QDT92833.1 SMI1 / KNR4 family protein [Gimesia algae]
MTKDEIRLVLDACLQRESPGLESPSSEEWQSLEGRYACRIPAEVRDFIDLMAEYEFPGDILNVGGRSNNGNDTIELTYEFESKENPTWSAEMIPFYSIGNGDYFCVSSLQCPESPVYYYYAEQGLFKHYIDSFKDWILELPRFLS